MPKLPTETPEALRPYIFHGVDLSWGSGKEAKGLCPFCEERDSFSVDIKTGLWRCWRASCDLKGNACLFIRALHKQSFEATTIKQYRELANDRMVIYPDTIMKWELCVSTITGNWLVPGYNAFGKLTSLYQYYQGATPRRLLLPTPTLGHHIHGVNLYDPKCEKVYLCEGPWDAIVLWEMLANAKEVEGKLVQTASRESSLLNGCSVLAVPGCNVFYEAWLPLFEGKIVEVWFDNDHPLKEGETPAGLAGTKRTIKKISPVAEARYLEWASGGYDLELRSGTDVRDYVNQGD